MKSTKPIIVAVFSLLLISCSSNPNKKPNKDPFETFNRGAYAVNKVADKYFLRPVAVTYDTVTPDFVQNRFSDFFRNLNDVLNFTNDLLQLKFSAAGVDLSRFIINSTVGIGGLFDVASRAGISANDEDFGQTLGYWGVPSGPFIMVPFLGPKTLRSGFGNGLEPFTTSEWVQFDNVSARNSLRFLEIINDRVALFPLESTLEDSLDEYATVRDAYLQRRNYLVLDGKIPVADDNLFDDFCEEGDPDCEEF